MTVNQDNRDRLKILSEQRSAERSRIFRNARVLRESLKPTNLFERATQSTRKNASEAANKIVVKAEENKGIIAALGGTLVAALLYQPLKFLITGRQVDDDGVSADEQTPEDITTEG